MYPAATPRKVLPAHLQNKPQTPSSVRKPNVGASPQVKEALAAMRRKRAQASQGSTLSSSSSSTSAADPFLTPAKGGDSRSSSRAPSRASSSANTVAADAADDGPVYPGEQPGTEEMDDGLTEVERRFNLEPQGRVVAKAKKTGRLNLSSRELTAIPPALWSLLPRSSLHHPSHATSPASRRAAVNLSIAGAGEDEHPDGLWYEEVDLKILALANNEITHVDDALGDFDVLDTLDLHNNQLPSLPLSFCGLACLTTLNLSHNPLGPSLPLVLLSLPAVRDLSLASCHLQTLWTADWKSDLEEAVRPPGASPSATPQSPDTSVEFAEMFPSSPTKKQAGVVAPAGRAPWPRLRTLSLRDNRLEWAGLRGVDWPANLVTLDLSGCGLRDEAVNPAKLGRLGQLEVLDLAKNHLSDRLFVHPALDEHADDEDAAEGGRLFGALKSLELELNEVDSFAGMEGWLHRNVGRPLEWAGVDGKVRNLINAAQAMPHAPRLEGAPLAVKVEGNPMREEQARRRAMFPPRAGAAPAAAGGKGEVESSPAPAPASPTPSPRKERVKEQWELDAEAGLLTEGGKRKARILAARRAQEEAERAEKERRDRDRQAEEALSNGMAKLVFSSAAPVPEQAPPAYSPREAEQPATLPVREEKTPEPSPPSPTPAPTPATTAANDVTLRNDPAVKLVQSGLQSRSSSLVLSNKALTSLPTPPSPPPAALVAPPQAVDLQHNALTTSPFAALATGWGWAHSLRKLNLSGNRIAELEEAVLGAVVLAGLVELNLSANRLAGDGRAVFERVAEWAPALEVLDVSRNALTAIEGVEAVLLPSVEGGKGLKMLILRNNKVDSLGPLAAVAERLHAGEGVKDGRWRCELVDVQENEVGRLEPRLGWLLDGDSAAAGRKVGLLCGGNRFRVPRREVVDSGGGRGLLEWLRERA